MKHIPILLSLLAVLFTWGAWLPDTGSALRVAELNTSAFVCDGQRHELVLEFRELARVRKVSIWLGAFDYVNADIIYSIEHIDAAGKYTSIAKGGYDHYVRGGGLADQTVAYNFAPDWIQMQAGETLALEAQCNPMDAETKTKKAHEIVLIYYQ